MARFTPLILLLLFVAAWVPRVVALDAFVTPDERKWLARSANFYEAISRQGWADTFQREHPGVTVMWAGTLGFQQQYPSYPQETPGQFTWEVENIERWLIENGGPSPLTLMTAGRWWITVWISLAIALSYLPLRRLIGGWQAGVALLFAAWDTFAIGLSRQLHPDGLSAALTLLTLVCLLRWLYGGRERRYLLVSALTMTLAWLTKSPTILLVPIIGLLGLVSWWRDSERRTFASLRPIVLPLVGWGLLCTALFFALWPSMWVDPLGTLQRMAVETSDYVERHVNANYFMGQPTNDPGPLFYPIAYLFRATPLTVIGLCAAAVLAWRRVTPFDNLNVRRTAAGLLTFALLFALIITVGAKKFDRYLLPAFLPLDLIAALGWVGVAAWLRGWWARRAPSPSRWQAIPTAVLAGVLLLHSLPILTTAPYYLTYYNPLVGGSATAPYMLFVGWGEGLDDAARWLNQQPQADELRVTAWYADGPFSYYFKGRSEILTNFSPLIWLDTDFAVLYVNAWQRDIPSPEVLAYFAGQPVVYTAYADGLELARVYDLRNSPLPDFIEWRDERRADFGGLIRLAGYRIEQTAAQPGDEFQITLYEKALAPMNIDYNVLVRLVAQDGRELWRNEQWPWGAPTTNWEVRDSRPDGHTVRIPADAPSGLYRLVMSFYDPATFASLPITEAGTQTATGESERVIDFIRIGPAPTAPPLPTGAVTFGEVAALSGATHPTTATPGEAIGVDLLWQSVAYTPTDYTVFVHLVDKSGMTVAQSDQQPMAGFAPTHLWDAGENYLDSHTLRLPTDLPPGSYTLRVGMYTAEGGRLPVRSGGDFATLGTVEVP